ncbi:MAG TPA: GyrI-like domain-containing protein [Conexibacter sp.]|nr:GyrI-like domain-containing protein [Conexibacter sp.]
MPFAVETAVEPPRRLLALRATTTDERMHGDAVALVARLLELLPWAAEPEAPPVVGLYPLDLDGELPFSVGVEATDARVAVPPPLTVVELPGGPVARVLHSGSHAELALAYFPLLAWLQERGHAATGPVRERYLDDPARVDPERLRTEVSIPLDDHHDHEETIR